MLNKSSFLVFVIFHIFLPRFTIYVQSKVSIYCLNNVHGAVRLVGMHWYHGEKGLVEPNCPTLAICYDIGRCQLMRSQLDTDPILLDTGIEITCSAWNENGSLLAVAGLQKERDVNVVQFYSAFGEHLRSLCLPGKNLTACAWEGNGSLRLALAVDSLIYFANLRPDYKWAYCNTANTIIYAFTRAGSQETCVVFWNTKNNQTRVRSVFQLSHICAAEDYACLVCRNEPASSGYTLTLCNALGVSMDSKRIPMEPTHVLMTGQQVIAVNKGVIYAWQFFNPKHLTGMRSALTNIRHREGSERICHVDLKPVADTTAVSGEDSSLRTGTGCLDWSVLKKPTPKDPDMCNRSQWTASFVRRSSFRPSTALSTARFMVGKLHTNDRYATVQNTEQLRRNVCYISLYSR
ncbi:WD repeat domain 35 [Paragonimus kellicotti]|nr:WD repeat domain 35 [Paragonimus kellicotti]